MGANQDRLGQNRDVGGFLTSKVLQKTNANDNEIVGEQLLAA